MPPPGVAARTLTTSRGDFAVLDTGGPDAAPARATALLLPGFMGSKEDFVDLLLPLAARGYRVVAVDGRGQYESDGPRDDEAPYALAELARDVLAQRDALDPAGSADGTGPDPGPVHLLGHSFGGHVAREAVLAAPEAFVSLTLMSSGPAEISPSQRERVKLLRDALGVLDPGAVWDAMQSLEAAVPEDAATGAHAAPGSSDEAALRARWLRNSPAQLLAAGRHLCAAPDRVAELAALPLPLHVLSGEHDDTWPVPLLDGMADRLAARRTVVAGADHSPNTDRPAETADALARFWDAVPG